jgi:hypothetical protein
MDVAPIEVPSGSWLLSVVVLVVVAVVVGAGYDTVTAAAAAAAAQAAEMQLRQQQATTETTWKWKCHVSGKMGRLLQSKTTWKKKAHVSDAGQTKDPSVRTGLAARHQAISAIAAIDRRCPHPPTR